AADREGLLRRRDLHRVRTRVRDRGGRLLRRHAAADGAGLLPARAGRTARAARRPDGRQGLRLARRGRDRQGAVALHGPARRGHRVLRLRRTGAGPAPDAVPDDVPRCAGGVQGGRRPGRGHGRRPDRAVLPDLHPRAAAALAAAGHLDPGV
ncbi:MAG: Tripartite tricarboxylate transporter TctB family, partial [uncultured Frankineae bacterium]